MGNAHSEDFRNPVFVRDLKMNYEKTREYEDPRFGDVQVYHKKFNPAEKIMFKQKWTNTPEESRQLHNFIETRRNISDPNVARLPFYEVSEEKQMLNTFFRHSMGFEYYNKNLQTEIDRVSSRINELPPDESTYISKGGYNEEELWFLSKSVISAMIAFRNANYHHGDIQPRNIMIDNDGNVKMIDNSLANYGRTAYHKMVFGEVYTAPLSPILMDSLIDRKIDPLHDKVKSDIFSLGITVLSAATNSDYNKYYDWVRRRVRMPFSPEHKIRAGIRDPIVTLPNGQVKQETHLDSKTTTTTVPVHDSRVGYSGIVNQPGNHYNSHGSLNAEPNAALVHT